MSENDILDNRLIFGDNLLALQALEQEFADSHNLIIETKKTTDIEMSEVQAKAAAAKEWCKNATEYTQKHGGKPWLYLLIAHDAVAVNKTLSGFYATTRSISA